MKDFGRILLLASICVPHDDGSITLTKGMQDLVEYDSKKGPDFILGCDAKMVWGSIDMIVRYESLLVYIISVNLMKEM